MSLSEEERQKLINYMYEIGFIVDSTPLLNLKTDEERYERIRKHVKDGYRIMLFMNQPEVVNIYGHTISEEMYNELLEAYKWLTSNSEPKGSTHNSD